MERSNSICEQTLLVLKVLFVFVALATVALVAPADWRRHFGKVRLSGGQSNER